MRKHTNPDILRLTFCWGRDGGCVLQWSVLRADKTGRRYSVMTAVGRGRYLGRVMGEGVSEDLLCKDLVEGSVSGNQSRQGKSKCRGPQAGHEEQQGVRVSRDPGSTL